MSISESSSIRYNRHNRTKKRIDPILYPRYTLNRIYYLFFANNLLSCLLWSPWKRINTPINTTTTPPTHPPTLPTRIQKTSTSIPHRHSLRSSHPPTSGINSQFFWKYYFMMYLLYQVSRFAGFFFLLFSRTWGEGGVGGSTTDSSKLLFSMHKKGMRGRWWQKHVRHDKSKFSIRFPAENRRQPDGLIFLSASTLYPQQYLSSAPHLFFFPRPTSVVSLVFEPNWFYCLCLSCTAFNERRSVFIFSF